MATDNGEPGDFVTVLPGVKCYLIVLVGFSHGESYQKQILGKKRNQEAAMKQAVEWSMNLGLEVR